MEERSSRRTPSRRIVPLVLRALQETGPVTLGALADFFKGVSTFEIKKALKLAVKDSVVEQPKRGFYRLAGEVPPEGENDRWEGKMENGQECAEKGPDELEDCGHKRRKRRSCRKKRRRSCRRKKKRSCRKKKRRSCKRKRRRTCRRKKKRSCRRKTKRSCRRKKRRCPIVRCAGTDLPSPQELGFRQDTAPLDQPPFPQQELLN
ncbi:hypothetical protein AAG570_010092 [Ranatra chinensis]|uniref:Uncharacterized protein n=1 Tax=Ranatra chinensis TaxID=642074 RepID=A0ABD0YLK5_9HEMI